MRKKSGFFSDAIFSLSPRGFSEKKGTPNLTLINPGILHLSNLRFSLGRPASFVVRGFPPPLEMKNSNIYCFVYWQF